MPILTSAKSLGVSVDRQLKFVEHVSSVIKKVFLNLRLLYSNRHILSRKIRKVLAESLVLSHFNYCRYVYRHFLNVIEQK